MPFASLQRGKPCRDRRNGLQWPVAFLVFSTISLFTAVGVLLLAPLLSLRLRQVEDQAAADAAYLRRQAELRAEAEAAEVNLERLDRRISLVSLGFREVARLVAPAVVNITNEVEAPKPVPGRTFYDFDSRKTYLEQAEGSGLLVSAGKVLTNRHVIRDAKRLRITFSSGRWLTVEPGAVAADALTDLAVIQLPESSDARLSQNHETLAVFADSDRDVQVGDWVLAVGSPFGLRQSVTAGIVSAKGRVELGILDQVELLQTDAAINPGNSGGPLFDQKGRVIGINVAIASKTGRNQGVAFAIPSNTAREVFDQLVEKGEVVRGFLGISMQEVPRGLEQRLGLGESGGVIVSEVSLDSPASQADLRRGDVIVNYNGESLGTHNSVGKLRHRIAHTSPDSSVRIDYIRSGKRGTTNAIIVRRPAFPAP